MSDAYEKAHKQSITVSSSCSVAFLSIFKKCGKRGIIYWNLGVGLPLHKLERHHIKFFFTEDGTFGKLSRALVKIPIPPLSMIKSRNSLLSPAIFPMPQKHYSTI